MSIDQTTRRMQNFAAYKEYTDRRKRVRKRRFRLFGRTPEKVLRAAGLLLIVLAAGLLWWRLHPQQPAAVAVPAGLEMGQVQEVFSEKDHSWYVEGVVTNRTEARVGRVTYGLAYFNAHHEVVSQSLLDLRNLQPRENRPFRIQVAAFVPGLERHMGPAQFSPAP